MRLEALERRIAVDLELGRHDELVPELEALVAREPLRERPREQLMVALYRSGRQADALEEYRRAREVLLAELGLEPSTRLRELEQQILRQEPALEAHTPTRKPDIGRRRRRLAPVGAIGVALALVAALFGLRVSAEPAPLTVPPGSVGVLDPVRGRIVDTIPVGAGLAAIAYGHGSVWVASAEDGTVTRIDPVSRRVVKVIGVGAPCIQLAIGSDAVWVANGSVGTLVRIDPTSGTVAATIDLSGADPIVRDAVQAVAVGAGAIWVAAGPGRLFRVDPSTNAVSAVYPLDSAAISVTAGLGSVWVGVVNNEVHRLDPRSGRVTARIPVLDWPADLEIADGVLLVSAGSLWAVDPETAAAVPTPRIGTKPVGSADVPGAGAWVVELETGAAVELAPTGTAGRPPVPVGRQPVGIAFGDGLLWIAVRAPDAVT